MADSKTISILFYLYPFFGDYTYWQCYKIVLNELFEGKRNYQIGITTSNLIIYNHNFTNTIIGGNENNLDNVFDHVL